METWKDIPDYEGRYQVSDLVRGRNAKARVLKFQIINSGYRVSHLVDGEQKRRTKLVHRLVAETFLEASETKKEVNHKDGDKQSNAATNLEWVTRRENMHHAIITGLFDPGIANMKSVIGVKDDGSRVWFSNQSAAERALSGTGKNSSAIHHCLIGKKQSAYGFRWSRA